MRILIGLITALALAATTATPANAANATVLTKKDKRGDVKIYKSKKLSKTKKKSIDIYQASITKLSNGKYRYKVRIKKIHKSKKWDQIVYFGTFDSAGNENTSAWFKIRNSGGAQAYDSYRQVSCKITVKRSGRTAWVDVPYKCAPYNGDSVRLATIAGHYQSDAPKYSRDTVRLGTFRYPR